MIHEQRSSRPFNTGREKTDTSNNEEQTIFGADGVASREASLDDDDNGDTLSAHEITRYRIAARSNFLDRMDILFVLLGTPRDKKNRNGTKKNSIRDKIKSDTLNKKHIAGTR